MREELLAEIKFLANRNVFKHLRFKNVQARVDHVAEGLFWSGFFQKTLNESFAETSVNFTPQSRGQTNNAKFGWIVNFPQRHGDLGVMTSVGFEE